MSDEKQNQATPALAVAPCSATFVADCVNAKRTGILSVVACICVVVSLIAGFCGSHVVDVMATRFAALFNAAAVTSLFFERVFLPNIQDLPRL